MKGIAGLFIFVVCVQFGFSQKNLDFERWDINYEGIDEAVEWLNVTDASQFGAPQVLFKEVDDPAYGLASIKLTTKYWKAGADYQLDTLIGALVQTCTYRQRPVAFEFSYQAYPKKGDESIVAIQLIRNENGEKYVVGEGYYTAGEKQKTWKRLTVNISYFSDLEPNEMTLVLLSSSNNALFEKSVSSPKIGSTLLVDNIRLVFPNSSPNLSLLNTVK